MTLSKVTPFYFIKLMYFMAIRPILQHKCSEINFFSYIRDMFRPSSGDITKILYIYIYIYIYIMYG